MQEESDREILWAQALSLRHALGDVSIKMSEICPKFLHDAENPTPLVSELIMDLVPGQHMSAQTVSTFMIFPSPFSRYATRQTNLLTLSHPISFYQVHLLMGLCLKAPDLQDRTLFIPPHAFSFPYKIDASGYDRIGIILLEGTHYVSCLVSELQTVQPRIFIKDSQREWTERDLRGTGVNVPRVGQTLCSQLDGFLRRVVPCWSSKVPMIVRLGTDQQPRGSYACGLYAVESLKALLSMDRNNLPSLSQFAQDSPFAPGTRFYCTKSSSTFVHSECVQFLDGHGRAAILDALGDHAGSPHSHLLYELANDVRGCDRDDAKISFTVRPLCICMHVCTYIHRLKA